MNIGYARVSTLEQDLDLQMQALRKSGCKKIFREKVSGASRERPEFQRMLDHFLDVEGLNSLARLGLARALALSGDTAKARTAYQDFLKLWSDADPDIPVLKQAKAEYAKLM